MKIKEAVYKTKMVKQRVLVSDEVYGCDCCRKEIKDYPNENPRLDATIHFNSDSAKRLHFCSWVCCFKKLSTIKTDYFISLPFMMFDNESRKSAKELQKLMKKAISSNSK